MERIKQPPLSLRGTGGPAESQRTFGQNMQTAGTSKTWKLTEKAKSANTSHTDLSPALLRRFCHAKLFTDNTRGSRHGYRQNTTNAKI